MKHNKEIEEKRALFTNRDLKCGGFYELCIEVCSSLEPEPVRAYFDHFWARSDVEGPFDDNFEPCEVGIEKNGNAGMLTLGEACIPVITWGVREANPLETGSYWFDIGFHTAALEHVFGEEYVTWSGPPNPPPQLKNFLTGLANDLYQVYPFRLALLGYETSGNLYLHDLAAKLEYTYSDMVLVGRERMREIAVENWPLVTVLEDL